MSVRSVIYDAMVTALEASTGINLVTKDLKIWWELTPDDYPAVCIVDADAVLERFAYLHPTLEDMEANVQFDIKGWVKDYTGQSTTLDANRAELISDIETSLTGDAALDALTLDVVPGLVQTDKGADDDNRSWIDFTFNVNYIYNHLAP